MCAVLFSQGFGATCTTVFEDNEGAKHLARHHVCTSNSEHTDVRHHFLLELMSKGEFGITHVQSDDQRADFLTKPTGRQFAINGI